MPLTLPSHAKINLFLEILGKREDGFHAVRTLMLPISLADTLTIEDLPSPCIEIECSDSTLPTDGGNLIRRAAELLQQRHAPTRGARIHVQKNIPIGAGLGGGSTNGSTTLRGLNQLWNLNLPDDALEKLAAEFGSDTAFFIRNKPALSEGRGEIITPVPFPASLPLLLMNFGFGSATAWAYKNLKLDAAKARESNARISTFLSSLPNLKSALPLHNDLETPVFRKFPILKLAKDFLSTHPSVTGAMMCGSGSTMMAILQSERESDSLRDAILQRFGNSVWVWTGHTLQ